MTSSEDETPQLIEGRDYTIEAGRWVFTADYLRRRGHCCSSGCRHCPYRDATPPNQDGVSNPENDH